jgi:hypothetical protein
MLLPIFVAPYKQKKREKKRKYKRLKKNYKKIKKYINKKDIPKCLGNYRRLVEEDQSIQD